MSGTSDATAAVLRERARVDGLWVQAAGSSMGRRYPAGTRMLVDARSTGPRAGEVWAFVDDADRIVAHRYLYRSRSGGFRFRGDAAVGIDAPVVEASLIGRITKCDDGLRQWEPRRWHLLGPTFRTALGSASRFVRRARSDHR